MKLYELVGTKNGFEQPEKLLLRGATPYQTQYKPMI